VDAKLPLGLEVDGGGLVGRHPDGLRRAAVVEEAERLGQQLPADVVEHTEDGLGDVSEADDNLGRPQFCQACPARLRPHRRDHVCARTRGKLHREAPDSAGRTGDQHPTPDHRPEPAESL